MRTADLIRRRVSRFARFARRDIRRASWRLRGLVAEHLTVRTPQGIFTVLTSDDGIGMPLYVDGQYEFDSSVRVVTFLKNEGLIPSQDLAMFDIGANIGVISVGLVRNGLVSSAIAIEPSPINYSLLCRNISQNDLSDKIITKQCALGEHIGSVTLELNDSNPGDNRVRSAVPKTSKELYSESKRETVSVNSIPLDQLNEIDGADLLPKPSLLWIDVQGYEGYIFKGGADMLASGLPTVSEIWPYGILRAGMSLEEFTEIAATYWTHYWVERGERFVRYPIGVFDSYLSELGTDGDFGNVIFARLD